MRRLTGLQNFGMRRVMRQYRATEAHNGGKMSGLVARVR
ncbi:hypothetical protein COHCIP112018_01030 [Cohnella sp. JJ-181]|nr:hypothetical protein COHCIP112018_01030 [Cohnella sp. JJ-181]